MNGLNGKQTRSTEKAFCKACGSPLVQATDWRKDGARWRARIWCPECGVERDTILTQEQAAHLSVALEGGFAYVLEALAELQDLEKGGEPGRNLIMRLRSEGITPANH